MKSLGQRADGMRLERMRASPLWTGESFRNIHPALPGLRDTTAARPTMRIFCAAVSGGYRAASCPR